MSDLLEQDCVLLSKTDAGAAVLNFPITRANCVEGVGRSPGTAYIVGDVVACDGSAKHLLLCTTAGTTAETDLNIASRNTGDIVTDGTVTWEVIDRRITFNNLPNKPTTLAGYGITDAGLPVGHEFFTTNPNIPAGCIPLLGGEYSRTAYADLWAWVQTQTGYLLEESAWQAKATANGGNVPFYSKGDGSTTFRVPALQCWVRGAGSMSDVGGYLAAGLPNITGGLNNEIKPLLNEYSTAHNDGALYTEKYTNNASFPTGSHVSQILKFDASKSNSIYGNSTTVQPPSLVGLWVVKAYGTVTNVGSTDVANISTGLTQAETRISALENHGAGATVVESYRNGTEWYRVWSDGWLEQGGLYIANPKNTVILTINLLLPMSDAKYTLSATLFTPWQSSFFTDESSKDTASFKLRIYEGFSRVEWKVEGQGAQL